MPGTSQQQIINTGDSSNRDRNWYTPLYKAAVKGDWEIAKKIFESDPSAMFAKISDAGETALHIGAVAGQTKFVKELLDVMAPEKLVGLKDNRGYTALYSSAISGDVEAAKAMVIMSPNLPQIRSRGGKTPILEAAECGFEHQLRFLLSVTRDDDPSPFQGHHGVDLLNASISAGFFDVALHLVQHYSVLSTERDGNGDSALETLAKKPSAFMSGSGFGFWQRSIYSWIPLDVKQASTPHHHMIGDTEDPTRISTDRSHMPIMQHVFQSWSGFFRNAIKHLVPPIKQIHDTKLMHMRTHEIMKCICSQVTRLEKDSDILSVLANAAGLAAKSGAVELIALCLESYPAILWLVSGDTGYNILHNAIFYRQVKVFKFIRGLGTRANDLASWIVGETNTLHVAATLAPSRALNSISGVALQMQRELQWYKEVEKIEQPRYKELENEDGKTPRLLFTDTHRELVEKGEKWMKETASSCMLVATLITTVVFTAAFTVPGGNISDKGIPIFLKAKSFMVSAVADALALFSSSTAVLIFLSILTSRYAEEDFFKSLPRKLIIGLSTLFFSIATMMIAFSATVFIMLGHQLAWVSILIALPTCLPVTIFAFSHIHLLIEMICSTYGFDIFSN